MARHHSGDLPIEDLPSRLGAETITERDDVIVCHGSRTLAVYRVKPDGPLRRLQRWPTALARRP